jgi:predicted dehydrogenase
MSNAAVNRRQFIQGSLVAGAAAGWSLSHASAASAARVVGANERINIGLIGCGGRGRWIMQNMVQPANANTALAAVCDIWKLRQETYPAEAEKLYGGKPKVYADYRKLLDDADVDAVIIATPDHQHCGQTIDAVQAGKHVYVEKPIAPNGSDWPELKRCYEAVKASKCAVQHGSQGVSSPGALAIRDFIKEGKLGKLFRIESTESLTVPYWVHYRGPETEAETDWNAFLYNRASRPFNAHQHAKWMGYLDFTSGTIGGWMSHFINTVHFVTGADAPKAATAFGGRYATANDPLCDAPDQATVMLEYDGFFTQFNSHFGSTLHSESTTFMFEKGTLRAGFGHDLGNPVYSSEGVDDRIPPQKLLDHDPPYPGQAHVENWFGCIRDGGEPNANMDYGYKQGIAVLLGDMACRQGRRVELAAMTDPAA